MWKKHSVFTYRIYFLLSDNSLPLASCIFTIICCRRLVCVLFPQPVLERAVERPPVVESAEIGDRVSGTGLIDLMIG